MKNQITKTIACVLAGLSLSACGGGGDGTNLTSADYPRHPNNFFDQANDINGVCFTSGCFAHYPSNINIAPLTDTSGLATYRGTIQGAYLTSTTTHQTYAQEASFQVDFGARTVRYQGILAGTTRTDVSASYNSRGQLTGTYTTGSNLGRIIGLIGETELIGSFAADNGTSSGGFRGLRE